MADLLASLPTDEQRAMVDHVTALLAMNPRKRAALLALTDGGEA